MAVVAWNVALAAPIRTVAKVGVPARLEDKSRSRTIWPFAMVPGAVVKGALLMLYSPPCTLIGALEMPEISVQGGEYSINSAPFTTAPGTIANGQIVRLRLLSSSLAGTPTFATVRIGAASATFQATTAIALQGTNVFYYHSQPGDFIGDGERGALHAGTGWTLTPRRNYHNGVSFDVGGNGGWWKIELAAAGDSGAPPLAVGSYENAVRFPLENGTSPGLSVSNVRACNTLRGRFDVLEVAYAADGSVQRFAADLVQHCEGV